MESVGGGTGRRRIADGGLCQRAWHEPERIERSENVKVGRRRREFSGVESVVRLSSGQANVWSEPWLGKRDAVDVRNADLGNPKCNNGPDPR